MKNVVYRITFFILLIWGICRLVDLFVPFYWGNPWVASKMRHLERLEQKPNVLFFGSSRIYRQVIPSIFDQMAKDKGIPNVVSYNLGAPATFCPQHYFLFEEFIESEFCFNGSTVFIELMEVDRIGASLIHQERSNYWLNTHNLSFVLHSVWSNPTLSHKEKLTTYYEYTISYFERQFHIGHFGQALLDEEYYSESYIGKNKDGYYSLEENQKKSNRKEVIKDLTVRKANLTNVSLQERVNLSIANHNNENKVFDKVHYAEIMRLISKATDKNIDLRFVLLPRNSSLLLINLMNNLPSKNSIDLSDPYLYPEFYTMENSFDIGHLNDLGAEKLTRKLFLEWTEELK